MDDRLESISVANRTTASQREALIRRIDEVERALEEERSRGRVARRKVSELTKEAKGIGVDVREAVPEGSGRSHHGHRHRHRHRHSKRRHKHDSGERRSGRHGGSRRTKASSKRDELSTMLSSSSSLPKLPKGARRPIIVPELGTTDANQSKSLTDMIGRINGKTVKHLLFDPSVQTVDTFETTNKAGYRYSQESARLATLDEWDDDRPARKQTMLTRYVDVVLRQNMKPFQSTAMGGSGM